ncbi:MAG: helical backbone metal receptor [Sporocytophaga sp.]|nr:helical backbone metal receptor [Sporocytophaga sp.]
MKVSKTISTKFGLILSSLIYVAGILMLSAFTQGYMKESKIVSVNGTTTEILCALGLEPALVGVDVASTYPASVEKLPKVGHNRNISAEGIVALSPDLIVGTANDLKAQTIEQLNTANVKTKLFKQEYSVEGTKSLIRQVATEFKKEAKGEEIIRQLDADIAGLNKPKTKKKVLFIYARGAGTMMVAGKGTPVQKMIELAGGENAVNDFNDYKPLTAEALVAADPDVLLLFDSGLKSLNGIDGILKIQGVTETKAGKNKKIVEMDGQLLTGFGPRLGKALKELSSKIH